MAATKFGFLTQPNSTVQGYTLNGGSPATQQNNQPIQVACLNADGSLDATSTVAVTIAIGTNPTSGSTLSGTLVKNAVAGIASFDNLAITLGGAGYTLTATGSLTTATSNAFTLVSNKRVNPTSLVFTAVAGTGSGNAVGPYRFRPGRSVGGVLVSAYSTNTTDAVQFVATEPGVALTNAAAELFYNPALGSGLGGITTPFVLSLSDNVLNGACDIYAFPTTNTGSITIIFKRNERPGGQ